MILLLFRHTDGLYHFADAGNHAPGSADSVPHPLSRGVSPSTNAVVTRRIIAAARQAAIDIEAVTGRVVDKRAAREEGVRFKDTRKRHHGAAYKARTKAKRAHLQRDWRPGQ